MISADSLAQAMAREGLAFRGAFAPQPPDGVPDLPDGRPAASLVLAGWTEASDWATFRDSAEARDGQPEPLDRWSRRALGSLADRFGGLALDPADGPPWWPFQRWARRAEPVHPSPLGLLIHPAYGLWHAYRGALALPEPVAAPPPSAEPSPCATCRDRPCLGACPVGAHTVAGFAAPTCARHLATPAGTPCTTLGCAARRACPVAVGRAQAPDQARFHLRAFRARYGDDPPACSVTDTGGPA